MKLERVTITQEQINATPALRVGGGRTWHYLNGASAPGEYVAYQDGAGKTWYTNEKSVLTCPQCGHEQIYWDLKTRCNQCGHWYNSYWNKPDMLALRERTVSRQHQDITSGLGIGGAGSDDYNMATEAEQFAPQFSKHKSRGQLWQPCAHRGCDNEPVCLDCEYCDEHCHCGE